MVQTSIRDVLAAAALLTTAMLTGCGTDGADVAEPLDEVQGTEQALQADDDSDALQSRAPEQPAESALSCGLWGNTCVQGSCCPGLNCLLVSNGLHQCCFRYGPGQTCN